MKSSAFGVFSVGLLKITVSISLRVLDLSKFYISSCFRFSDCCVSRDLFISYRLFNLVIYDCSHPLMIVSISRV